MMFKKIFMRGMLMHDKYFSRAASSMNRKIFSIMYSVICNIQFICCHLNLKTSSNNLISFGVSISPSI